MDRRLTLLFVDGFDDRRTTSGFFDLVKGWISYTNQCDINAGIGRFGSQGVDMRANDRGIVRNVDNTDPTIIFGYLWSPTVLAGSSNNSRFMIKLWGDNGTVQHIWIRLNTDESIAVYRNDPATALLGQTAPNVFSGVGIQDYIEFKILISDTVGTVDIQLNEVNVLSASGLNTKNGGTNSSIDRMQIVGQRDGGLGSLDDLYIANGDGGLNNDFLGDVTVETKYPNAEGTTIQWTPSVGVDNSANVDEQPPDGVDINSDSTPGNIDMYETQNITDVTSTIYGVQVMSTIKKDTAGARKFRHRIDSNAVIQTKDDHVLSTTTQYLPDMIEADPDGGALWTGTKYNAAEFGVETRA